MYQRYGCKYSKNGSLQQVKRHEKTKQTLIKAQKNGACKLRKCHRSPYGVRLDCVRRPIGLRTPPDQIPYGVRSDCVRRTMTYYKNMWLGLSDITV